jgi:uncharacterized protein
VNNGQIKLRNEDMRIAELASEVLSNRTLELIIFPTEKCNFRCVYCYEDFKIGRMPQALVDGVKQLINHRIGDLDVLKIAWFGGEPLLAKEIMLEICAHASAAADAHGCLFTSAATSNGYLLDLELATKLAAVGVWEYQITLDGFPEDHDRTRVMANGDKTYGTIFSNLLALKKSDLDISVLLRLHYGPHNVKRYEVFLDYVIAEFGADKRFSVDLQAIQNWGGPRGGEIAVFGPTDRRRLLARFQNHISRGIARPHDGPGTTVCYAAKANSFVIRANGTIGKCTVALSDERNAIGMLNADGTVQISIDKLAPWINGIKKMDMAALSCPYSVMER